MAAGRPALTMRLSQFARDDSYSNPTNTALACANRLSALPFWQLRRSRSLEHRLKD